MSVAITAPGEAVTWGSNKIFSVNGAASTPPVAVSGTWFSGGSATTTKPQLLIEPAGTTSTGWSTSGTGLGVNAPSGFTGNLLDLQLAGVPALKIDSTGSIWGSTAGAWAQMFHMSTGAVVMDQTTLIMASVNGVISMGSRASLAASASGGGLVVNGHTAGGAFWDTTFTIAPIAAAARTSETQVFVVSANTETITGSYATQRFSLFAAPTITAASALTVTTAATVTIAGAPIVGGSAIITNPFAAWIQSGSLAFSNAGEPTTSPADIVQAYAVDIAAGRATLGLRTEEAVAVDIGLASTSSLTVKINGTLYKIPLVAV